MTTEHKSHLSHDEYLKAYALFTLAQSTQKKVIEYETAMNKVLGLSENGSRLSDGVYDPSEDFHTILGWMEVAYEDQPPPD